MQQAAALDLERQEKGKRSILHGIPILVKDNIAIEATDGQSLIRPFFLPFLLKQSTFVFAGMNTSAGSYALLGSIVPGDATVVAKLRKAGAILLGKANLVSQVILRAIAVPGISLIIP